MSKNPSLTFENCLKRYRYQNARLYRYLLGIFEATGIIRVSLKNFPFRQTTPAQSIFRQRKVEREIDFYLIRLFSLTHFLTAETLYCCEPFCSLNRSRWRFCLLGGADFS